MEKVRRGSALSIFDLSLTSTGGTPSHVLPKCHVSLLFSLTSNKHSNICVTQHSPQSIRTTSNRGRKISYSPAMSARLDFRSGSLATNTRARCTNAHISTQPRRTATSHEPRPSVGVYVTNQFTFADCLINTKQRHRISLAGGERRRSAASTGERGETELDQP